MKLRWSSRTVWLRLMALLLATGAIWIALSRVPAEAMAARAGGSPLPREGFTFGFVVPTYAMTLLLAVWVGLWLSEREARRLEMAGDLIYNLGLYTIGYLYRRRFPAMRTSPGGNRVDALP